ncbi:hypothetical protein [Selenomonas ruminantium]|nr:hypothetical protein [Selenomonas ruminantium]
MVSISEMKSYGVIHILKSLFVGLFIFCAYIIYVYNNRLGTARNRRLYYEREKNHFKRWRTYQLKRELSIYEVDNTFLPMLYEIIKWAMKLFLGAITLVFTATGLGYDTLLNHIFDSLSIGDELLIYLCGVVLEIFIILFLGWIINFSGLQIRKSVVSDIYALRN